MRPQTRVAAAAALGVLGGLVLLPAAPALAHGDLVTGSPGPGDAVTAGSDVLRLEFSGLARDGRAFVTVLDDAGDPVRVGDASVLDSEVACATTAPLDAGVYDVEYLLDADDGHSFSGRYSFEVVAGGGEAADPGACAAADLAPATEARVLSDFGSFDLPGWVPIGLGATLLVAVGLLVARVRRDRAEADTEADTEAGAGV